MKLLLLIFLASIQMASCAQKHFSVAKSYGFYRLDFPGIVPVGEEGRGADTIYMAFLETKPGADVDWRSAVINENNFRLYHKNSKLLCRLV
jgi:acyl dehydratase